MEPSQRDVQLMSSSEPPFTGLFLGTGVEMLSNFLWTTHCVAELGCRIQLIFHELVNQPLMHFFSVKQRLKSDLFH